MIWLRRRCEKPETAGVLSCRQALLIRPKNLTAEPSDPSECWDEPRQATRSVVVEHLPPALMSKALEDVECLQSLYGAGWEDVRRQLLALLAWAACAENFGTHARLTPSCDRAR